MPRRGILAAAALCLSFALAPAGAATSYQSASVRLGPVTQNPRVFVGYLGRDNGTSIGWGGRSYWFFGDTFLNAPPGAIDNSAATTTDLDGRDGIAVTSSSAWTDDAVNAPVTFLAASAAETAFENKHANPDCSTSRDTYCGAKFAVWPGSVVVDAARRRAIVFFTKICRFGKVGCPTGYTGTVIGTGLAVIDLDRRTVKRMTVKHPDAIWTPEGRDPSLLFGHPNGFAANAFVSGQHLYSAYGCDVAFHCGLARVPLARVDDRREWRFLTGVSRGVARWSPYTSGLVRVVHSGAAGGTIQWVPAMKAWLSIYAVPYASDVVWRTAPRPWGPWTAPQRINGTVDPVESEMPNYAAFAHPEYATAGGLVQYVTYYHPSTGELELLQVTFCPNGTQVCVAPVTEAGRPRVAPAS